MDAPLQLATSYLPAALVAEARVDRENTGPGGSYVRLAEIGRRPVEATERLRARIAMPDEAEALALGAGASVILIERIVRDESGTALEVNEITLDAAKYIVEYDFTL
jgi:GntR family transcriptional regulator